MIVKILDLDCALQQHEKEDSQQKGKTMIMIVNTPESQVVIRKLRLYVYVG